MKITAKAWGKINLHLGVGKAREDGYHELVTVFQTIDLFDTVELNIDDSVQIASGSVVQQLSCTGPRDVPLDESNLAWRAVDKLVQRWRTENSGPLPAVSVHITKGIPVAGGMAGGSADAAAALRATDAWLGPFTQQTLLDVAAELGSDVPFCLLGGTMLGTGRGEKLVDILCRGRYHWVIVVAKKGLSTAEVFRKYDELDVQPQLDIRDLSKALLSGDPYALAEVLSNDLQRAAFSLRPELRHTLVAGMTAGALSGIVSGSGPTIALLCANAEHAQDITDELIDAGFALSVHTATSPAPRTSTIRKI